MSPTSDKQTYTLSNEQRAAAEYVGGPLRIIAGAGTGKTSTLTARFVHLVQHHNVPAHEILAVTFSTKAAGEMRGRILAALGGNHRRLWIQTFHALCLRLLGEWSRERGEPDPRVLSELERRQILRQAVDEVAFGDRRYYHGAIGSKALVRDLSTYADRLHDDLIGEHPDSDGSARAIDLANTLAHYHRLLSASGAVDFGVLSSRVVHMLETDPDLRARTRARFRHVLVDEFQDTNHAQFKLISLLVPDGDNICVVGDANQAIYAFRGGRSSYFEEFQSIFPDCQQFELTQNYRSGDAIIRKANNLAQAIRHDEHIDLIAMRQDIQAIVTRTDASTAEDEADSVARRILAIIADRTKRVRHRDIAVLFRSVRNCAEPFRRSFRQYGIPWNEGAITGLDYVIRHDIRAAFRLVTGDADWSSAARIALNRGGRPLGRQALERLLTFELLLDRAVRSDYANLDIEAAEFLKLVGEVFAEAHSRQSDSPALALYQAMILAGHMTESLDPNQAAHLRDLMKRAASATTFAEITEMLDGTTSADDEDALPTHINGVQILTVHAAKGLEWPVVFVVGLAEGLFPLEPRDNREGAMQSLLGHKDSPSDATVEVRDLFTLDHYREERRLAYVAVTRAQRELHLTCSPKYAQTDLQPSRFFAELGVEQDMFADDPDDEYVRLSSEFALGRDIRTRQRRALEVLPSSEEASAALADLLTAQWAAKRISGVVPFRERRMPKPYEPQSRIRFSASDLSTYETCPRQYLYAALLKLDKEDSESYMLFGSLVHAALEHVNRFRQETGAIPDHDQVEAYIDQVWTPGGFDLAIQSLQLRRKASAFIHRYLDWERGLPEGRTPILVEHYARVPFGEHTLSGRMDVVMSNPDGSFQIIDYKSGKPRLHTKSKQLYLYIHIWNEIHPELRLAPLEVSLVGLRQDGDSGTSILPEWDKSPFKSPKSDEKWREERREEVVDLLSGIVGNQFHANTQKCRDCRFRMVCPDEV